MDKGRSVVHILPENLKEEIETLHLAPTQFFSFTWCLFLNLINSNHPFYLKRVAKVIE